LIVQHRPTDERRHGARDSSARQAVAQRELGPPARERFEQLRAWRRGRAEVEGVPVYVVFTNRELVELARAAPSSPSALRKVPGTGARKTERYGQDVLAVLARSAAPSAGGVAAQEPPP